MGLLDIDSIHKVYDEKVAVDNLSLSVPRGVIYGIIGPNGAGKTTTIRMIMNITIPDRGEIRFDGKPISDAFKSRVGYLPEERGLYKKMTCEEVLLYLADLKGASKADVAGRIGHWLERMELSDYRDKKVEELSKGMAQKLQFISTILHEPDIVVLDELFSGLDPVNTELLKDVILDLKRNGTTILFSTHVMEQAEKLCEYLCMISKGHKVLDGSLSDVKNRFGTNSIHVQYEGDGAFMKGLAGVEAVREFPTYSELRLADAADGNAVLARIIEQVSVRRFEFKEPSLYDIFIQMAKVDPAELQSEPEEVVS